MDPVRLSMRQVRRTFGGGVEAVADVTLDVAPGKLVALVGPSGCGKTTLLRLAGDLDAPDAGSIERSAAGPPGFCFQEPRLLPWRTVRRNVELPLELRGAGRESREAAALRALDLVALAEAAAMLPHQLSGGMRMRAALARAIVGRPGLLLLDEPFGALDEVTRLQLDEEFARLREREPATALLVTHSIQEAAFLADEVVVLSRRPARVVERFAISWPKRAAALLATPDFALRCAEIHGALRRGMEAA